MKKLLDSLNFKKQCQEYNIRLWQCPQFLFLVMGAIIILVILLLNIVARIYVEPAVVSLIVLGTTMVLFIISYAVVSAFEMVALTSKAKSEFISIMSHRLRTPVAKIKWQLNVLFSKKDNDLSEEKTKDLFLTIGDQNEKMIKIINDLLILNFIEDRRMVLAPSDFSLKTIADEVAGLLRHEAEKAGLTLIVEQEEELPDVFADRMKIKNIVYRLVDNAIRYSSKQGKVRVTLGFDGKKVRCSVADEGVGISTDELKNIFTKFYRNKGILQYQTEGTGIGLFITKTVIEKSGGTIGFDSIEGKGSTFWFNLPQSK